MSNYVVDITDAAPPSSTVAWTSAKLGESSNRSGPFTVIDTFTLVPDTDPALPAARSFHSENATLPAGWYQLTWIDPLANVYVSDAIWAGYGLRPTVQEVARLMPDRTTVDGGGEARTFNTLTSPTATEVDGLIDMVLDSVAPRVPDGASAEVERAARHVVTFTTAILVESGNWGEQLETNDARVALWERLLASHEATLNMAANEDEPGQARFGSVPVVSPTLTSWSAQTGVASTELIP